MNDGIINKLSRRVARVMPGKRIVMRNDSGVVSFSFDDVPRSACIEGRQVLEDAGVEATYYVCGGLTGSVRHGTEFHRPDDLVGLSRAGHEVACHGFAHRSYQSLSVKQMRRDMEQNRAFFLDLGLPQAGVNFSYPYGTAGPIVKQFLKNRYASARSVWNGINCRYVDLCLLRAVSLYEELWTRDQLGKMIRETSDRNGWLIFLTHSVTPRPGEFDCTPALLRYAIEESQRNNLRILPVKAALGYIGFRSATE